MSQTPDYQKGYAAGRRRQAGDIQRLESEIRVFKKMSSARAERVYLKCLEMALNTSINWTIGEKKITDVKGYCTLAKEFSDNSISELNK